MLTTYGLGAWLDTRRPVDRRDQAARSRRRQLADRERAKRFAITFPEAPAPLPFAASCVFCRGGYHHHAHFRGCRKAPQWARREQT